VTTRTVATCKGSPIQSRHFRTLSRGAHQTHLRSTPLRRRGKPRQRRPVPLPGVPSVSVLSLPLQLAPPLQQRPHQMHLGAQPVHIKDVTCRVPLTRMTMSLMSTLLDLILRVIEQCLPVHTAVHCVYAVDP